MNKVKLQGKVKNLFELKNTTNSAYIRFSLACITGQRIDYVPCVAWGDTARRVSNFLKKESNADVEGHITTTTYTKDDKKVYNTEVVVDSIVFLDFIEGGEIDAPTEDLPF